MHYYLYEIRNNINGRIYIGVHKTKNLDDGYMGSGKVITYAIEKHGIENFTKTILEIFKTQEEMFAREKEIVTEEFLLREDTYNLRRGGLGGWDYINKNGIGVLLSEQRERDPTIKKRSCELANKRKREKAESDPEYKRYLYEISLAALAVVKEKYPKGTFHGKTHSKETKSKIGEISSILQLGEKNSQFGSMWITNGKESKKIKKTDPIPEGWNKGRVLKVK